MTVTTSPTLRQSLQHRIDNKTKPLGALGRLEEIALQIGVLQGTARPTLSRPHIVVFAGDHGIAATGLVNPYPQAVTAQMVLNFIRGGAAINVFCRQHGLGLTVVDAGVNYAFDAGQVGDRLVSKKIALGTLDYLQGVAMSSSQSIEAIEAGREVVAGLAALDCNCVGFGEMGIGNTSSAALIMSFVTGIPVADCVGRGTGVNDEQLAIKKATLQTAYDLHRSTIAADPTASTILQCVGGFEIAMLTGAYLEAADRRMIILVDGFISTAALLLGRLVNSFILDNCIFSHCSGEGGHERMLQYLDVSPLLQLGMRLGEGTGAALAFPFVRAAVNFLEEMASFESAGVSKSGEASKEVRIFFTAIMFLTRLPAPRTTDHSPEYLRQAPRYFPMVGWIVGGLCSLAFWMFSRYVSPNIGILASMITGFLVTGCFHEDGFADVCDGMGGGWTKEKILLIMKDSRIGAYGAIGLISILATKFLLLQELRLFIPAAVVAHSVSRLMPVLVMKTGSYAADPDQSKARGLAGNSVSRTSLLVAIILALVPFVLLPWYFSVVVVPALVVTYGMYRWFFKWIGGYTGDCLGAIQQVTEITVYLGCILLWRYL